MCISPAGRLHFKGITCKMSGELNGVLTRIDNYYSRKYHMDMLKFLAQALVPYGQLEFCKSVPEVYNVIKRSRILQDSDDGVAVAILRYMLHVTHYNKEETHNLDAHCSEDFVLTSLVPSLRFYELLLILACRLHMSDSYKDFLKSVPENKLNKSRHDVSSPVDLFQSMICKGTLDPNDISTLNEVINILEASGMSDEAQFMNRSLQSSKSAIS